jgi:hypothetical protein
MRGDVEHCFDKVVASSRLNAEDARRAERQLVICDGSDVFWWFGPYNPPAAVKDFDLLYRLNLTYLYDCLVSLYPIICLRHVPTVAARQRWVA